MSYRVGMEKLLTGIVKYGNTHKGSMVKEFQRVADKPNPSAVFFTCVDSRLQPSSFTQTQVGDMFVVRNVGNMVPHSSRSLSNPVDSPATEPAMLELGVVGLGIQHVVVCGHSDCKAMNLLHSVHKARQEETWNQATLKQSPIRAWMSKHGMESLQRFEKLQESNFKDPLLVRGESNDVNLKAFIDVDQKFNDCDKLSQVHALVQGKNLASYPFLRDHIRDSRVHLHVMWFDIHSGDIYYFSRAKKCFVPISEHNYQALLDELEWKYRRKKAVDGSYDPAQAAEKILEVGSKHEGCDHKHHDHSDKGHR